MALAHEFFQLLVDGIAGSGQRALIVLGRIAALHDAEIGSAGADIDHQGVQQRFQTVGDSKRLGNQHDTVGDAFHGIAQVLPAHAEGFRGHADNGAHF